MGNRHQRCVVAKVGPRYRTLAVEHNHRLLGVEVIKSCLRLLEYLSSPENQSLLREELERAGRYDDSFWRVPRHIESESPAPFPFIATCLAVGANFDPREGYHAFTEPLPFTYRFTDMDNDDGFTVIDISDPKNPRYGFVSWLECDDKLSICTAESYLQLYEDNTTSWKTLIEQLSKWKMINEQALTSLRQTEEEDSTARKGALSSSSKTESRLARGKKRKSETEVYPQTPAERYRFQSDRKLPTDEALPYQKAFQAPDSTSQLSTSSSVAQVIWLSYEYMPNFEEQPVQPQSGSPPSGRKFPWSQVPQSNIQMPGLPLVACVFPLIDAGLSPAQFLQGLGNLLQYLTNSYDASTSAANVALAAAKSFALADGKLDGSRPSCHIGPLPGMLYSQASAFHHKPQGKPPMVQSLDEAYWTFILLHETTCHLWTDHPREKFRYAFVRAEQGLVLPSFGGWVAPNALVIANLKQFVFDTVGSSERSTASAQNSLLQYWDSRIATMDMDFCEKGEIDDVVKAMTIYSERSCSRSPFYNKILSGKFFDLKGHYLIKLVYEEFGPEFDQLKDVPGNNQKCRADLKWDVSPSCMLYSAEYDGVNKTFKSILAFRWLEQHRREDWTYGFENSYIYTLVVYLIATNLSRVPLISEAYCARTGVSRESVRHEDILLSAFRGELPDLFPCLKSLNHIELETALQAREFDFEGPSWDVPTWRLRVMAQMLSYVGGIFNRSFAQIFSDRVIDQYQKSYHLGLKIATRRLPIEEGRSRLRKLLHVLEP